MSQSEPRPLRSHAVDVDFLVDEDVQAAWDRSTLQRLVTSIVERELEPGHYSIALHLVSDEAIRELNHEHRGKDAPTDVLSFGLYDPHGMRFASPPGEPVPLGDVVVSYPRVLTQAEEYGHSEQRELAYLVAHGVLHILGYDHEDDEQQRRRMREREEAALAPLGLTRS